MRILERDGRVLRHKRLRLRHVVHVRVADRVAIAVKISGVHRFARYTASDKSIEVVDIADVLNAADLLRFLHGHAATRPAFHRGNRLFDKQNDMRRTMGIGDDQRHVLAAQTCQIKEMMVCFKGIALVHRAGHALPAVKHHHLTKRKLAENAAAAFFIYIHQNLAPLLSAFRRLFFRTLILPQRRKKHNAVSFCAILPLYLHSCHLISGNLLYSLHIMFKLRYISAKQNHRSDFALCFSLDNSSLFD